jgi:hypothetical protein
VVVVDQVAARAEPLITIIRLTAEVDIAMAEFMRLQDLTALQLQL